MTLQWVPDTESRNATIARLGTRGTLAKDVPYIVLGAASEDEIHIGANAYISSTVPYWVYPNQPTVRLPAQSYDIEYLGDQAWRVTIHYERQGADNDNQTQPLRKSRSFDTTGEAGSAALTAPRSRSTGAPERSSRPSTTSSSASTVSRCMASTSFRVA